jgi:hypothetical protein
VARQRCHGHGIAAFTHRDARIVTTATIRTTVESRTIGKADSSASYGVLVSRRRLRATGVFVAGCGDCLPVVSVATKPPMPPVARILQQAPTVTNVRPVGEVASNSNFSVPGNASRG